MLGEKDPRYAVVLGQRRDLWDRLLVAFITFLAVIVLHEMTIRVGGGHPSWVIGNSSFSDLGRFWGWMSAVDLVVTNLVTLITELIAIQIGMSLFGMPPLFAVTFGVGLVAYSIAGGRHWRWERVAMAIAGFNLSFRAGRAPEQTGLGRDREGFRDLDAPAEWFAATLSTPPCLQHWRNRHRLDALLPTERGRQQRNDPERHPAGH